MSNPDEALAKRMLNQHRARNPTTRGVAEIWLKNLGVSFVAVWFYHRGNWVERSQVDDLETFLECVSQELERPNTTYALWHDGEQWCLLSKRTGDTRRCPSREAAEMVAIHGA